MLCLDILPDFSYILVLHFCIRILYGAPARKGSIRTGFDNAKMCVPLYRILVQPKMMVEQTLFSCPSYCKIFFFSWFAFIFVWVPAGETLQRDMNCFKLLTRWDWEYGAMCDLESGMKAILGKLQRPRRSRIFAKSLSQTCLSCDI